MKENPLLLPAQNADHGPGNWARGSSTLDRRCSLPGLHQKLVLAELCSGPGAQELLRRFLLSSSSSSSNTTPSPLVIDESVHTFAAVTDLPPVFIVLYTHIRCVQPSLRAAASACKANFSTALHVCSPWQSLASPSRINGFTGSPAIALSHPAEIAVHSLHRLVELTDRTRNLVLVQPFPRRSRISPWLEPNLYILKLVHTTKAIYALVVLYDEELREHRTGSSG
jgi:hypothetical protein